MSTLASDLAAALMSRSSIRIEGLSPIRTGGRGATVVRAKVLIRETQTVAGLMSEETTGRPFEGQPLSPLLSQFVYPKRQQESSFFVLEFLGSLITRS